MGMVTLQLPQTDAEWIDAQVATGRFPDAESFVAELIPRDRADAAKIDELRVAIGAGRAGGLSERNLDEIFGEAMERHAAR